MKILLPLLLVLPLASCPSMWSGVETDPDKITTTVGEWEPPMLNTLHRLQEYRPDMAMQAQGFIEIFSQPGETVVLVQDISDLTRLMLAYIAAVDQDATMTSDEKDLDIAIPNVWLEVLRKFKGN